MIKFSRLLIVAPLVLLAACHLVDQRDFDPNAGRKPVPPAAKPGKSVPGPAPLITITYTTPEPDYSAGLADAVKRALAVKPNVLFSVQTLVPLAATPGGQAASLQTGAAAGREIGDAIVADGADQGQIELTVRGDPSVHSQEVRVFVH
jgi:hypothetical protein